MPRFDEWEDLFTAVGGEDIAGEKLKSGTGWNNCDDGSSGNGTDDYGFSALPGGYGEDGYFYKAGGYGYWWSATDGDETYAWGWEMHDYSGFVYGIRTYKTNLYSVRCLKDE